MNPLKLAEVRKHIGRQLTYAEAITLANPGDPFLRNMAVALSLHTWNNTAQDWLRLEEMHNFSSADFAFPSGKSAGRSAAWLSNAAAGMGHADCRRMVFGRA